MSVARRRYTPDEKKVIYDLWVEGWTYKRIAEKIRPGIESAWRSIGDIIREKRSGAQAQPEEQQAGASSVLLPQRAGAKVMVLPKGLEGSVTAQELLGILDKEQHNLFISTYEGLRGEANEEQLTSAENEMLMRAAFSHTKYIRAQHMCSLCESYLIADLEGRLPDDDETKTKRRFAGRGDAYKKEAEQWHNEYMELIDGLKLTRKQRLDKIKDNRNTFLDLQQELNQSDRQRSIIEEIKRINMATEEEFYRMAQGEVGPDGARHPWMIGAFDHIAKPQGSGIIS